MTNRLSGEKSPYLRQHAENPVDWYPFGSEAFARARREDKPVLVSIGYSACHWCHVMAHESFEDERIAAMMNGQFVNIKVDREERPDVDAVYMEAVQALTGHGGWPLNVFVTPDGRPFFGGTYFPPEPGRGLPSWPQVIDSVSTAYREQREDVMNNAAVITEYIQRSQRLAPSGEELTPDVLAAAYQSASAQFDWKDGGFGGAPKFPQPVGLEWVLRMHARFSKPDALRFVEMTLHRMAEGGIFDQIGGGFHRYSVDSHWIVPHFEKMLYDNALLARVYLQAYQLTHNDFYRGVTEATLDYLLREMRAPEGAFYASEDADSEGIEGKYYVWDLETLERILGPEAGRIAALRYGVTRSGNFEGKTVLTAARSPDEIASDLGKSRDEIRTALREIRREMLDARSQRVPPGRDTKILVSWNALAIRALAEAGATLNRSDYIDAAVRAADFILTAMRPEGRLVRSYQAGPGRVPAFLEDYAFLMEALITLFESTGQAKYFATARDLADQMVDAFWDDAQGAFFDSPAGLDDLIVRPRGFFDNPIPSGNSAASFGFLRLEALTGQSSYTDRAVPAFRSTRDLLARAPLGFAYLLSALDFHLSSPLQIAIAVPSAPRDLEGMVHTVFDRYLPNKVVATGEPDVVPLLAGRTTIAGHATAYVCRGFTCDLPVTSAGDLVRQLENSAG